uniref:Piwi domain-containing protein n=3 Tax=Macrostomum lignano TaxID=282301 RepID=A0A1I8JIN0_9PLAT
RQACRWTSPLSSCSEVQYYGVTWKPAAQTVELKGIRSDFILRMDFEGKAVRSTSTVESAKMIASNGVSAAFSDIERKQVRAPSWYAEVNEGRERGDEVTAGKEFFESSQECNDRTQVLPCRVFVIVLDECACPISDVPRRVAHTLRRQVAEKLEQRDRHGVIEAGAVGPRISAPALFKLMASSRSNLPAANDTVSPASIGAVDSAAIRSAFIGDAPARPMEQTLSATNRRLSTTSGAARRRFNEAKRAKMDGNLTSSRGQRFCREGFGAIGCRLGGAAPCAGHCIKGATDNGSRLPATYTESQFPTKALSAIFQTIQLLVLWVRWRAPVVVGVICLLGRIQPPHLVTPTFWAPQGSPRAQHGAQRWLIQRFLVGFELSRCGGRGQFGGWRALLYWFLIGGGLWDVNWLGWMVCRRQCYFGGNRHRREPVSQRPSDIHFLFFLRIGVGEPLRCFRGSRRWANWWSARSGRRLAGSCLRHLGLILGRRGTERIAMGPVYRGPAWLGVHRGDVEHGLGRLGHHLPGAGERLMRVGQEHNVTDVQAAALLRSARLVLNSGLELFLDICARLIEIRRQTGRVGSMPGSGLSWLESDVQGQSSLLPNFSLSSRDCGEALARLCGLDRKQHSQAAHISAIRRCRPGRQNRWRKRSSTFLRPKCPARGSSCSNRNTFWSKLSGNTIFFLAATPSTSILSTPSSTLSKPQKGATRRTKGGHNSVPAGGAFSAPSPSRRMIQAKAGSFLCASMSSALLRRSRCSSRRLFVSTRKSGGFLAAVESFGVAVGPGPVLPIGVIRLTRATSFKALACATTVPAGSCTGSSDQLMRRTRTHPSTAWSNERLTAISGKASMSTPSTRQSPSQGRPRTLTVVSDHGVSSISPPVATHQAFGGDGGGGEGRDGVGWSGSVSSGWAGESLLVTSHESGHIGELSLRQELNSHISRHPGLGHIGKLRFQINLVRRPATHGPLEGAEQAGREAEVTLLGLLLQRLVEAVSGHGAPHTYATFHQHVTQLRIGAKPPRLADDDILLFALSGSSYVRLISNYCIWRLVGLITSGCGHCGCGGGNCWGVSGRGYLLQRFTLLTCTVRADRGVPDGLRGIQGNQAPSCTFMRKGNVLALKIPYNPCRRTQKWPTKLGAHLFLVLARNGWVVYRSCGRTLEFLKFLETIIKNFIDSSGPGRVRAARAQQQPAVAHQQHSLKRFEATEAQARPTKRCRQCYRNGQAKKTVFCCGSCEGNPGLAQPPALPTGMALRIKESLKAHLKEAIPSSCNATAVDIATSTGLMLAELMIGRPHPRGPLNQWEPKHPAPPDSLIPTATAAAFAVERYSTSWLSLEQLVDQILVSMATAMLSGPGAALGSGLRRSAGSRSSFHVLDIKLDTTELELGTSMTAGAEDGVRQRGAVTALCHTADIDVLKYSDVPHFLRHNGHIREGYTAYLSGFGCIRSVFRWTNETINIWSHLFGFGLFFLLMLVDNIIFIPLYNGTLADHLIVTGALMCFQFCMLCSSGYHTFKCHSERAFWRWLSIDQAGICVGLIGCYLPSVHFGFYCLSLWRDIYLFVSCSLCLLALYCSLQTRGHSKAFKRVLLPMYCCLAGFGTLPAVHWVYLNGGFGAPVVSLFFHKIVVVYFLAMLGLFFYVSKFPECILPGKVDYIGSSHQWWHAVVTFALLYWHNAGGEMLQYRTSSMGSCETAPTLSTSAVVKSAPRELADRKAGRPRQFPPVTVRLISHHRIFGQFPVNHSFNIVGKLVWLQLAQEIIEKVQRELVNHGLHFVHAALVRLAGNQQAEAETAAPSVGLAVHLVAKLVLGAQEVKAGLPHDVL